jgi:hypothetical protein
MAVKTGNYKGSPTISLLNGEDDKYPFTFGVKKAQLIVNHIEDIKQWLARQEAGARRSREDDDDNNFLMGNKQY